MSWAMEYVHDPHDDASQQVVELAVAAPSFPARLIRASRNILPVSLFVAALLLFWQYAIPHGLIPGVAARYLSTPSSVVDTFGRLLSHGYLGTPLWREFEVSLLRALVGASIAALIGVPVGLAMGLWGVFDRLLTPVVGFLRPIPPLAWIPVVVIWFGIGELSKVYVIFMAALLFTITGAQLGVKAVPEDYFFVARNYELSRWVLLRRIVFPRALPQIIAGLRTAVTVAWAVVIAAELLGASSGLGYMISNSANQLDVDTVYVGIVLIGVVGVAFEYGFRSIERRFLHWQSSR